MKWRFSSGLFRTLGTAGCALLIFAADASAASWQWSAQSGRERITLDLDAPKQEKSTGRTGSTEVTVNLQQAANLTQNGAAPSSGSLVSGVSAAGDAIRLQLRDAAFGYIVSRPNARRVVIDVFPDPLGTRWRDPGAPAPATAASRAASAQPEAPTVPTPPAGAAQNARATGQNARATGQNALPAAQGARPNTRAAERTPPQGGGQAAPAVTEAIPVPTTGQATPSANTTIGRMAAANSRRDGERGTAATAPSPTPANAQVGTRPISAAERERLALQAPAASGGATGTNDGGNGVTGKFAPPPPSPNDIAALTARIETLPPSVEDSAFAWPDLNRLGESAAKDSLQVQPPTLAPVTVEEPKTRPNRQGQPALGSAERAALERSLGKSPEKAPASNLPPASPAAAVPASPAAPTSQAARQAVPSPAPSPAVSPAVSSGASSGAGGQAVPPNALSAQGAGQNAGQKSTGPVPAPGLANIGPVRGKMGGAPLPPVQNEEDAAPAEQALAATAATANTPATAATQGRPAARNQAAAKNAKEQTAGTTGAVVQPRAQGPQEPGVSFTEQALQAGPEGLSTKRRGVLDAAGSNLAPSLATAPSTAPSPAAPGSTGGAEGDWSHALAPNALRAQLNTKGPDNWPQDKSLSTLGMASPEAAQKGSQKEEASPLPPETRKKLAESPAKAASGGAHGAAAAPATGEAATGEEAPAENKPAVIYVDEEGKQIPKPPDVPAMIADARKKLKDKQDQEALDLLQQIKELALTPQQREDVLYLISDATENVNRDKGMAGFEPILASTNEAMNFNLRSPRVADALMRLGMTHLRAGNQDAAAGYFGALKNDFPLKPDVPVGYLALGRDQFDKGQYAEAVRSFQLILDKYPESRAVRDASRYMAEALYKQGHDSRALILVDFVNRRWPRLYLEDTDYLAMVGDLLYRQDRLDDALQTYWTYYNLMPDNPRNDEVLLRLGTIYMRTGFDKGAKDVFDELMRKYPKSEASALALRRLGENGIYDGNPTLEDLYAMFAKPNPTSPDIYYQRILDEHPDSQQAPTAALRLAAWRFWNKDATPAMQMAQDFLNKYPSSPYAPRAEELIQRGFDQAFALALEEENYDRVLTLWDRYPQVQLSHPTLSDDLRVSLARAHLNRGEEKVGMELLEPFLNRPQSPQYGEYVYNLFLARALRTEDWNGILDLGEKVAHWDLPAASRAQFDYARAISAENLGLAAKALALWRGLYQRDNIPLYQKAYATYFMARDAERRRDLKAAYQLNLDTLKFFTQLQDERSDKADPERVRESLAALMDVTEVANRFAESLDWADKYAPFVPKDSPDYAALQFRVARLHRKMGDLGRWKSILDEIVAREPSSVYGRMASSELRTQEVARDLTRFAPGN